MPSRCRSAAFAVALLSLVSLCTARAFADIIIELEPNNSFAEANPLVGDNDLGAIGTLSADLPLGDPADVFSLTVLVAGNIRGTTHISTPLVSPNTILIRFLDAVGTPLFLTPSVGEGTPGQTVTWDRTLAAPGIYYASIQRTGLSIPPPSLDWDFRLSGVNSAPAGEPSNAAVIASGPTAVPEPGSLALLGLGALALWLARRQASLGRNFPTIDECYGVQYARTTWVDSAISANRGGRLLSVCCGRSIK